ncbi:MAG: Lrp/AsnC family transcriptional regulator [Halobacteriota archaeon]|nr:Lrp/AsnC family transcriptional regulator [Halobacteriota archaeon]
MDEELIGLLHDIPLTRRPFEDISGSLGIKEEEVISRIKKLIDEGKFRRFSGLIAHRAIGITANAMCMWNVPEEKVEEIGKIMASFDEVTHCYERKNPWGYNLFTMVHGYERSECREVIKRISQATGITDYSIMFSDRELKKV